MALCLCWLLYILALHFVLFLCTTAVWQLVINEYVMLCYSQECLHPGKHITHARTHTDRWKTQKHNASSPICRMGELSCTAAFPVFNCFQCYKNMSLKLSKRYILASVKAIVCAYCSVSTRWSFQRQAPLQNAVSTVLYQHLDHQLFIQLMQISWYWGSGGVSSINAQKSLIKVWLARGTLEKQLLSLSHQ